MTITSPQLRAAWEKALARWGLAIQVDLPHLEPDAEALAFIDLETRRVVVNPKKVAELKAEGSLEGILAHELGHHLRCPHSLAVQARLELFEREVLPIRAYSLLNLFSDFLINTELGHDPSLQKQLADVYLGMPADAEGARQDPAFYFYITAFEEAWGLEPRTLTRGAGEALEKQYPGCRAEAQLLAQELPNLAPNLFTQYLYFASVLSRYQPVDADGNPVIGKGERNPTKGDHSAPSAGDYADALRRSAQESEAIRRAIEDGWLKPEKVPDAAASERIRTSSLPGVLAGEPKKLSEAMALHYRRLAEKYLVKPPKSEQTSDPFLPTTLSPWEVGDSPKEIDWLASILASGPEVGAAMPLKRDLMPDDPTVEQPDWRTRLEIYLDVSGSMPDPKASVNPMTLAAQVLAMSAIRGGGQVRGLIYSTNNIKHWDFTRSEVEISRFLMNYIGGGTDFPFEVLRKSVVDCGRNQPVRIVLTDSDFSYNLKGDAKRPAIAAQAAGKAVFVALLNGATADAKWVKEIAATGITTIPVASLDGFPKVAAALGEKLFGEGTKEGAGVRGR